MLPQGTPQEHLTYGLQQAAGGLTSAKYRKLLFQLLQDKNDAILRELEADLKRQGGEKAAASCALLRE
jgi:hypothetical protein